MSNKSTKSNINYDTPESILNKIEKKIDKILTKINEIEERQEKLEKIVLELINKKDIDHDTLKKENMGSCQEKINPYFPEQLKIEENYKRKEISDFINSVKLEYLGYEYFSVKEIENDNETINSLICDKAYDEYLPDEEKVKNETVGKFFYSIGGISRVSHDISKNLFFNLFELYKNFLDQNKSWLTFNHENDRRNLSIWIKKSVNENPFYEFVSITNIKKIEKYFYKDNKKANGFLFKIFQQFLSLYLKCRLSIPIVEVNFLKDNCEYDPYTMLDIIDKRGKAKKVNFCYIPELKSNGKTLRNGKFYVFTYIKNQTYQKEGKIYDYKQEDQNLKLYTLPDFKEFKYSFNKSELKVVSPLISPELKPKYKLYKNNYNTFEENNNGIFKINQKELNYTFKIEIKFANNGFYKSSNISLK